MVKNENYFLGLLIKNADKNHDCDAYTTIKQSGLSDIDCLHFIKSLEDNGLVNTTDTNTIHIYPKAYEEYESAFKKIKCSFLKTAKFTFKIILEIIVAIAIAGIIFYFGWQ